MTNSNTKQQQEINLKLITFLTEECIPSTERIIDTYFKRYQAGKMNEKEYYEKYDKFTKCLNERQDELKDLSFITKK